MNAATLTPADMRRIREENQRLVAEIRAELDRSARERAARQQAEAHTTTGK